jgi:hypothetical protein
MALRLLPTLALLLLASAPIFIVSASDPDPLADFVMSGTGKSTAHMPKSISFHIKAVCSRHLAETDHESSPLSLDQFRTLSWHSKDAVGQRTLVKRTRASKWKLHSDEVTKASKAQLLEDIEFVLLALAKLLTISRI